MFALKGGGEEFAVNDTKLIILFSFTPKKKKKSMPVWCRHTIQTCRRLAQLEDLEFKPSLSYTVRICTKTKIPNPALLSALVAAQLTGYRLGVG